MSIEQPLEVTKTVYTVLDFLDWQRSGALNLRPYFQRGSVWTPKAKSYFMDTLLRGYPVPIIFLQNKTDNRTLKNVRQVVDGQQRLRTVLAYIDIDCLGDADDRDEVKILKTHNKIFGDLPFEGLPQEAKDRLTATELSVHVLPSKLEDAVLLQLFARLNSTGEKLNDQELRNAAFHGAFKALAYDLSYEQLDRWREWSLFTPRALAQMREVELASELMMFLLRGIVSKSKSSIDKTYKDYEDAFPFADRIAQRFRDVFDILEHLYLPDSRHGSLGELQTQSWLYAMFALVATSMFGAPLERETKWGADIISRRLSIPQLQRAAREAQNLLVHQNISDSLAKALRGASSDASSRQTRFNFLLEQLDLI